MYKIDIQLRNGQIYKKEVDAAGLRNFIHKKRFTSPMVYANVITPSGVKKSILKYMGN